MTRAKIDVYLGSKQEYTNGTTLLHPLHL